MAWTGAATPVASGRPAAANGASAAHFDCLALWREHADFVAGKPLQGGHYLVEEVPEAVLAEWVPFFAALV